MTTTYDAPQNWSGLHASAETRRANGLPVRSLEDIDFEVTITLIEYGPGCLRLSRARPFTRTLNLAEEAVSCGPRRRPAASYATLLLAALLVLASAGLFTYSLIARPAAEPAAGVPSVGSTAGPPAVGKRPITKHDHQA